MARYSTKEIIDKTVWEKFVLSQNPKSFLQSWNWGETNHLIGKKIVRLGIFSENTLVGVCLIVKECAKRGPHLVISGGPLIDWKNKALVSFTVKELKRFAKIEKVWFVRIRPELQESNEANSLFGKLGFISAPMHLHAENTWILNIEKSDDDLLAGMRKNTRYLIRKALKSDLVLSISKDPSNALILEKLQQETIKRNNFVGFSKSVFESEIISFTKDDQAEVYLIKLGKEALVASIIVYYGNYAYYHFSGSSNKNREIPSSYLLQWEVIKRSREKGLNYYNFWGIAPADNPKHRFARVSLFKKGFGGESVNWVHAHDIPVSNLYWITYFFETLRRIFCGL